MSDDTTLSSSNESHRDPNISGAGPDGTGPGLKPDDGANVEDRSFQTRPGDVEAHDSEEGGSVRDPRRTAEGSGGDQGRDPHKDAAAGAQETSESGGGDWRYDPSAVESTRVRMQGGGMGQRDLDQQGSPGSSADPAAGADATEGNMSSSPDPDNARS